MDSRSYEPMRPRFSRPGTVVLRTLVATLGGLLLGACLSQVAAVFSGEGVHLQYLLPDTLWLIGLGFLVALPLVLAYGIPVYLLLRRLSGANLVTASLVGAAPGLVAMAFVRDRFTLMLFSSGIAIAVIFQCLMAKAEVTKHPEGQ
jgi:hypothetical protein